jgi:nucleoside-diphosphate-sugar epimerase
MKLLITGAGGFLGQFVVASAVSRGHCVRVLIRPASRSVSTAWQDHPQVEIVRGDLRARGSLSEILDGVDTVIHLAATKSGDLYEQFAGTVLATENLLHSMRETGVNRLVVTSSFSVYEYLGRWAWSMLNEESPLARIPADRDEYCQTKLEQERIVREHFKVHGGQYVILRPGVIYGPENLWTARLGMQMSSRWWIRTGAFARLPTTYVENCAEAVTMAAEYDGKERELVLNVVDGDTPSQRRYLNAIRRRMSGKPRVIPIPWTVMRLMARLAWLTNQICFRGTAKIPGIFVPSRLHARCKPLRYSNKRIVQALGWSPQYSFDQAIERSLREQPLGGLKLPRQQEIPAEQAVEHAT